MEPGNLTQPREGTLEPLPQYLGHQPRVSQKLLHRIKTQTFGHEVHYASCIENTFLERFARGKRWNFLGLPDHARHWKMKTGIRSKRRATHSLAENNRCYTRASPKKTFHEEFTTKNDHWKSNTSTSDVSCSADGIIGRKRGRRVSNVNTLCIHKSGKHYGSWQNAPDNWRSKYLQIRSTPHPKQLLGP
jgi:hypothetical protein